MAEDDKRNPAEPDYVPATERLQKALEARWDPGKLSRFMRTSEMSRSHQLDFSQRSRFEGRLGVDLSNVRIFTGELAEEITRAHGAEALTVGDTGMILMRQSTAFSPGSAAHTGLLAHELTHVAQAKPSAISFKKPHRELAQERESEEEAEAIGAEEEEKDRGSLAKNETQADKKSSEKENKDDLVKAVMKLMNDDVWLTNLRNGTDLNPRR